VDTSAVMAPIAPDTPSISASDIDPGWQARLLDYCCAAEAASSGQWGALLLGFSGDGDVEGTLQCSCWLLLSTFRCCCRELSWQGCKVEQQGTAQRLWSESTCFCIL
jgi:hypothetical protein